MNRQSSWELWPTGRRHLELQGSPSPIQTVYKSSLTGISTWDWSVLCVCLFSPVCTQLWFPVIAGNSQVCVSHLLSLPFCSFFCNRVKELLTWPGWSADCELHPFPLPGPRLPLPARAQLHCPCPHCHPPKTQALPCLKQERHLTEHKEMHMDLKLIFGQMSARAGFFPTVSTVWGGRLTPSKVSHSPTELYSKREEFSPRNQQLTALKYLSDSPVTGELWFLLSESMLPWISTLVQGRIPFLSQGDLKSRVTCRTEEGKESDLNASNKS